MGRWPPSDCWSSWWWQTSQLRRTSPCRRCSGWHRCLPARSSPDRATGAVGAGAVAAVMVTGWAEDTAGDLQHWVRVADVALISAAATAIAAVRGRRERRLARIIDIAEVAQRAILPTLPARTERVAVACRYLSAARDAVVGGDLYDCSLVGHRTRFLVGDVRGKGMASVEQAARVIRAFRQAAALYPRVDTVAEDMNSYLIPFFDDEEFVTGLLVDVTEPDTVVITSCGHPPAVLVPRDGSAAVRGGQDRAAPRTRRRSRRVHHRRAALGARRPSADVHRRSHRGAQRQRASSSPCSTSHLSWAQAPSRRHSTGSSTSCVTTFQVAGSTTTSPSCSSSTAP